eukprot:9478409-Pyramimonas_sp.AAC.3
MVYVWVVMPSSAVTLMKNVNSPGAPSTGRANSAGTDGAKRPGSQHKKTRASQVGYQRIGTPAHQMIKTKFRLWKEMYMSVRRVSMNRGSMVRSRRAGASDVYQG